MKPTACKQCHKPIRPGSKKAVKLFTTPKGDAFVCGPKCSTAYNAGDDLPPGLRMSRPDLAARAADFLALTDELTALQERHQASAEYLLDCFVEAGASSITSGTLRAKVQSSFPVRRRPTASQAALDEVFESVPYQYVKVWHSTSKK